MSKEVIYCTKVPQATSPHSHAVRTGNLVFVSGCAPYFGDLQLANGDFAAQMHQVMQNMSAVLEEAGSSLEKVVKVNVFLDSRAHFEEMNAIYREYFGDD